MNPVSSIADDIPPVRGGMLKRLCEARMNSRVTRTMALPADERFEVVRIRLRHSGRSAVVTELRAADVLLVRWAESERAVRKLGFELTFDDGCSLCGDYDYGSLRKAKPSLSRFVRQTFKGLAQVPPTWPCNTYFSAAPTADPSRYVIE